MVIYYVGCKNCHVCQQIGYYNIYINPAVTEKAKMYKKWAKVTGPRSP